MQASDKAWLVLAGGVIAWDSLCADGQTLSDGADHYMLRHPWLTRGIAFALAAHVCNLWPDRYDPVHKLAVVVRAFR